jgi:uncharacterized damage-inducible protein DinB
LPVKIALVKQNKMKEKLLSVLENSKSYTSAVANAMPEEIYKSQLLKDSWAYDDLLIHIAYGIRWWDSNVINNIKTDWEPPKTPDTKKAVLKYMEDSYDILKKTVENSEINDELIYGFNATIDHITHHRAQAVLFLRNNNITPPEYVY